MSCEYTWFWSILSTSRASNSRLGKASPRATLTRRGLELSSKDICAEYCKITRLSQSWTLHPRVLGQNPSALWKNYWYLIDCLTWSNRLPESLHPFLCWGRHKCSRIKLSGHLWLRQLELRSPFSSTQGHSGRRNGLLVLDVLLSDNCKRTKDRSCIFFNSE